jgi:hypothetical protein
MKHRREKNKSFPVVGTVGWWWAQGKGERCVYGICVLYPHTKIEE